ncbi:hypothetical protein DVS77_00950 [Mycolicibacterium moriokaense]|nr:hypothetical protein DVS77_00950 [Mycolicibacterium moriokaense]
MVQQPSMARLYGLCISGGVQWPGRRHWIYCYGHAMRFRDWAVLIVIILVVALGLYLLFTGAARYTDTP